ncbi:MAG: glutamyl-tRNA reductase, partial [Bryobacterales bacterium]|nr:glutamyl-tRNA reductase [Bryobacterales bacterium]
HVCRLAWSANGMVGGQRSGVFDGDVGHSLRSGKRAGPMKLALVGINHRTAPVDVREKLAIRSEDIPAALEDLQARGVKESLILSTCNRVEVLAAVDEGCEASSLIESLVGVRPDLTAEVINPHLYCYEQAEAMRHLFRVASSLDSMIVGEPQILGQLKQAYAQARDQGTIGTVLDAVLTRAFNVAKRIRTETEIGQSAVSVSYAAVELAREIFGSLRKKRVLIIGAGKMSEAAVRDLLRAGAAELLITNRTPARAEALARLFMGEVVPYELFPHRLHEVDIVITSSGAPGYVLNRETVQKAIEARRNEPMFFIDIAVPRNIEPDVNRVEHAFLYDIDDLQGIAARNLKTRLDVAEQAEGIVAEEVTRLEAKLREREVTPTIVSLQAQLELIRQEVLDRYRPRMGTLNVEQEEILEAITRGIVNKIAHGPVSEMRRQAAQQRAGDEARDGELVSVVRRMFRLRDR